MQVEQVDQIINCMKKMTTFGSNYIQRIYGFRKLMVSNIVQFIIPITIGMMNCMQDVVCQWKQLW